MNNFFKSLTPKSILFISIGLAAVVAGGLYVYERQSAPPAHSVAATRESITETVMTTGTVAPVQGADLAFERSGTIAKVYVAAGDAVSAGDPLVALSNSDLSAQYRQADAAVSLAEAQLAELKAGAKPEDLAVQQAKVAGAAQALTDAEHAALVAVQTAYAAGNDAIHNQIDQLFVNPLSTTPQLVFIVSDSQLQNNLISGRQSVEGELTAWQGNISSASFSTPSVANISAQLADAARHLTALSGFLQTVASAVNSLTPSPQYPLATVIGWRTTVSGAIASLNGQSAAIAAAEQSLTGAQTNLTLAQGTLSSLVAGATAEQISASEAQVQAALAARDAVAASLDKTVLRAPFSGVVAKVDANVGDMATPNVPTVTVVSNAQFEVDTSVAESDIAAVKVGDSAAVTLDAYGSGVLFPATVSSVDSAPTTVNGVSAYAAKLQFNNADARIKSGMTANVTIIAANHDNALVVPAAAVIEVNGTSTVMVDEGSAVPVARVVTTGIRSADGKIEILSGLVAGEKVLTY